MSTEQTTEKDYIQEVVLAVLRRHGIGAFNGSQVACSHCRIWQMTDEYHQHIAELVARWQVRTPAGSEG